jgi:hypothetical protein
MAANNYAVLDEATVRAALILADANLEYLTAQIHLLQDSVRAPAVDLGAQAGSNHQRYLVDLNNMSPDK